MEKPEAALMWLLSRMLRISWNNKTKVDWLTATGVTWSLIRTKWKRQRKYMGHINRGSGMEKLTLSGKNIRHERIRKIYLESVNSWAINFYIRNITSLKYLLKEMSEDTITNVCFRLVSWWSFKINYNLSEQLKNINEMYPMKGIAFRLLLIFMHYSNWTSRSASSKLSADE